MELNITQVDAFTARPFQGNPAGVCVIEKPLEEDIMQAIAAEMNLSETAFLYPIEEGYHLRWFTPAAEVDLCGHGTLASAHVLWKEGHLDDGASARFQTKSGWLSAQRDGDWIQMDLPALPVTSTQYVLPQLIKSLCCHGNIRAVSKNDTNFLVEVTSETSLKNLQPDFQEMQKLPVQGIIATAKADSEDVDFVSRYFAPAIGVDEDPVTGSAHSSLAPYWKEKLNKSEMLAHQVSARGGLLKVKCVSYSAAGDEKAAERVLVSGQAVTVMKGKFFI